MAYECSSVRASLAVMLVSVLLARTFGVLHNVNQVNTQRSILALHHQVDVSVSMTRLVVLYVIAFYAESLLANCLPL